MRFLQAQVRRFLDLAGLAVARYTLARRAKRPWLVQMFEVAFSRRMCCSRVLQCQHPAAIAATIDSLTDDAARMRADECFLTGHNAQVGTTVLHR